jgi:ABC-2 type transport system ATP-binding protein
LSPHLKFNNISLGTLEIAFTDMNFMDLKPVILTTNLKKKYKGSDLEALKGINLNVYEGEFFGLLGPNSAGKTTLNSLICGLINPTSGNIRVFDKDVTRSLSDVKKMIGLVPQEIALYSTLTVKENILFFGHMHGFHGIGLHNKLDRFIEIFNLAEHESKLISRCSGGIKRRVNLICGLIHDPILLLLDEPTLGVDIQLRTLIFDYLIDLNKKGTTILYTTHYMKEAEMLCNRVNIIDHGEILAGGKPIDLIAENDGCIDLGQVFLKITGRDLRD